MAVILRSEDVNIVGAIGSDTDVTLVGGAQCCGAIVRFQNRGALIYVAETEEAKFAGRFGKIHWHRVCAID